MAYLNLNSSVFLGNYDSLVESCFDYAFEREDECLFEEMVLQELSDDLKLRAANKLRDEDEYRNARDSAKSHCKYFKDEAGKFGEHRKNKIYDHLEQAQRDTNRFGKAITGKRNRIINFYLNSPTGKEYTEVLRNRKGTKERTYTYVVDDDSKDYFRKLLNDQNNQDMQKEYENLVKEVEKMSAYANSPEIDYNYYDKKYIF